MALNLVEAIQDDRAVKEAGFAGVVFLTYTLNLRFYEQIIAPALDRAACANALIIADPDGYADALQLGAMSITGAGRRYVCVPLSCEGRGIQHVKLVLMAGAKYGRMLIGSGNLTLHGYGRNLELFSRFDLDVRDPDPEVYYAFAEVWGLLEKLDKNERLSGTACSQLAVMREKARWLTSSPPVPADFRVWHNYTEPIWKQLSRWRADRGWDERPLRSLRLISPYYDRDLGTLLQVTDDLQPSTVGLYLGPSSTNLDMERLGAQWGGKSADLHVSGIDSPEGSRWLHAKAIIGVEDGGAWCITGSANVSRPALLKSWSDGGNLELVTFRWSPDAEAFEPLWDDESVRVWTLQPEEIVATEETSEGLQRTGTVIDLMELTAQGQQLKGRISQRPADAPSVGELQLLRASASLPVEVTTEGRFALELGQPLNEAEAARLVLGEYASPYRWIDQPEVLAKFGARTYHTRVRGQLETFDGADKLFGELLNFLWERVDRTKIQEEAEQARKEVKLRLGPSGDARSGIEGEGPPAPPPGAFVTDEDLVTAIGWRVEQQLPYDRHVLSLRDLFSLVLLRLTTPTESPEKTTETGERDEEADQDRDAEREGERIEVLKRLCSHLMGYCRRYGKRLVDANFVAQVGLKLLFQNHFTLGRILLEFSNKVAEFTEEDLLYCFWWAWSPLFWPTIVGLSNVATWDSLIWDEHSAGDLFEAWNDAGLALLTMTLMTECMGTPPSWHEGLWDTEAVQHFLTVRELINRMRNCLRPDAFDLVGGADSPRDAPWGPRSIHELWEDPQELTTDRLKALQEAFDRLADYRAPGEEKYARLLQLAQLTEIGQGMSAEAKHLSDGLIAEGLADEVKLVTRTRARILPQIGSAWHCPCCFLWLPEQQLSSLRDGNLVLCDNCQQAVIYWCPDLLERVV